MMTKLYLILFIAMTLCQISLTRPMGKLTKSIPMCNQNIIDCLFIASNHNHISSMHATGREYRNAQFQFSVVLPYGWSSSELVEMFEKLERETYPFTPQSHKSLEERYREGLEEVLPLFTFSKKGPDATNEKLFPTIQAMAYNTTEISKALTNCSLLNLIHKGIEAAHTNGIVTFVNECGNFTLNGISYASQIFHMNTNENMSTIKQQIFVKRLGDTHVLYMALNYSEEQERGQLLDIVKSLRFHRGH